MRSSLLISWFALLAGIAAWVGVVFFFIDIRDMKSARQERLDEIEQLTQQEVDAAKVKALLNETKNQRANLTTITAMDVLSIVKIVETVGNPIGVPVRITNASPSGPISKNSAMRSISITIGADGSYNSLLRLTQLFESLSLPSVVEGIDLYKSSTETEGEETVTVIESTKSGWHLDLQIKIFTTASIST